MQERTCTKCNGTKDESEFSKKHSKFTNTCLVCQREMNKKSYYKKRSYYVGKAKTRNSKKREWFKEFKKTLSCEICGENHESCIDFHHVDPKEKEMELAYVVNLGWSIERILKEVDKCKIVCSNCHRKIHWEERQKNAKEQVVEQISS